MDLSIIRDLTEGEIALVTGGTKQTSSIIEAPPPPEPQLPPLPGVILSAH